MPYYTINHQTMQASGPFTEPGDVAADLEDEVTEDCIVGTLDEDGTLHISDAEDWLNDNVEE